MTAVARSVALPRARARRRPRPVVELALWTVVTAVVTGYLVQGTPETGQKLLVGNVTLAVALLYGFVRCALRACRRAEARRAWALMAVSMGLATLGQVLFASAVLSGAPPSPSSATDLVSYLGYSLPLLIALFGFPQPSERRIARLRGVLDAMVITTGVLLISERTVLGVLRHSLTTNATGLYSLAYPIADIALCAVVLTLGMRQPPESRLAWLCLGTGLMSLAVTDSLYVRLLADGAEGLTGGPLVVGWVATPVLIGVASLVRTDKTRTRHWNLDLAAQLVPYVPVLTAGVVLAVRPVRADPLLILGGVLMLVTVSVRQVMIVYENLTLTRGLEQKVAERTAELATFGSIVTSSRDAIVSFGLDRSITAWNPAAERLFGLQAEAVLGRVPSFLPQDHAEQLDALLVAASQGEPLGTFEFELTRSDGPTVPIALTVSPVHDAGAVSGISFFAQDITERRRAAEALEQAREEALQSARAKTEFLATMSHEIRTPMNGVIGLVSLLSDTELDTQQRDYVEGVHHAGQALLDVINDILDFSKLEAGKVVLAEDDVDLRKLVEEVGDLLSPAAYAKGLELLVDIDPATVGVVRGDHVRIRQILLNLASNAVKFTADGEVRIRVTSRPADHDDGVELHIEVVDTGIGIAEEDQPRLFESFAQADASTTRRYGGTGLGLAICRQVAEVMNGEIGVTSTLGAGSTFWFDVSLPVGELPVGSGVGPVVTTPLPGGMCGLVVDDNATNRTILTAQLEAWGVRVDVAGSAEEALKVLRERRSTGRSYDFAVLDMLMPDVDGLELARRVSADPLLVGVPMIMLSSAPRLRRTALREARVGRWLSKPVRAGALHEAIAQLVAGSGRREDVARAAPAVSDARRASRSRGLVLVVEDNELNQLVARGLVERLGFETAVAGNGVEALEVLGRHRFDVVLMDCHMPVMDGFAATERIRETERGRRRTPVVALTASALDSDRERCLAAGMDDHVAKPIDPDALATVLDRWVPVRTGPALAAVPDDWEATVATHLGRDAGPIDAEQIAGLAELRTPEGASLLSTFITSFARQADSRLAAIRDCAGRADDDALAMAAHELRGSAATIGAIRVAALCTELERGRSAVLGARPGILDELTTQLGLAVQELELYRACSERWADVSGAQARAGVGWTPRVEGRGGHVVERGGGTAHAVRDAIRSSLADLTRDGATELEAAQRVVEGAVCEDEPVGPPVTRPHVAVVR